MLPFEPLMYDELSPRLQDMLPPDTPMGVKSAAASGLVPLGTNDLVSCFYFLASDEDAAIRRTARNSLRELPMDIVRTAVQGNVHEKVLHWFAHRRVDDPAFYESILMNRQTADETFAYLAGVVTDERALTLIAQNEDRFVRMPEILEALEQNPATPISTLIRAKDFFVLQLGVSYEQVLAEKRKALMEELDEETLGAMDDLLPEGQADQADVGGIGVDGFVDKDWQDELPPDFNLDDLQKEVFTTDNDFAVDLLIDPEEDLAPHIRESLQMKVNRLPVLDKLRLAMKGNIEARNILIKSPIRMVQECVLRNPKITVEEVVKLAKDKTQNEEIIRIIAGHREWVKNYAIVHALCWNPKTPMTMTTKYLNKLTEKDLAKIGKSKQVPGLIAITARKMAIEKARFN